VGIGLSERLEGKTALVTGGGAGIGRGGCLALAAAGAAVVVTDLDLSSAEETVAAIELAEGKAWAAVADVTDPHHCAEAIELASDRTGRLDVLFHAAGTAGVHATSARIEDLSDEVWDRFVRVNLTGSFNICRAAIPAMRSSGGGSITMMGSGRALFGMAGQTPYAATKAGVAAFARSLSWEVGPYDINVNAILPGVTDTSGVRQYQEEVLDRDPEVMLREVAEKDPLGRVSTPEDVGSFVVYLATDGRWVTGGQHSLRLQTG
jgi:NAD(P)-dependent dehydrogenase (short-subunit alcohol dehydrogenase family)